MQVSFVIPLHNGLEFTQEMLASLRATLPAELAHEIILVDNGSTDGTRDWLQTLKEKPFRIVLNEGNLGYAEANNLAVRQAHGGFVALLNNDLVLLPGWIEPMIELAARPGIGIVGNVQLSVKDRGIDHAGIFFDQAGQPVHFRPSRESLINLNEIEAPAVTGACMVMKREIFQKLGGFDEGYRNGYEDIDLCMKALSAGHHAVVAMRSVCYHYVGMSAGRHDQEDANAARFQGRWGRFAKELSRIEAPGLERKQSGVLGAIRPTFDGYATLQVFHPGVGGHAEQDSTVRLYSTGSWARVRAPLPFGVEGVRLDPCDFPGTVRIKALELSEVKARRVVWSVEGEKKVSEVLAASGTTEVKAESDQWLTVESTGNDPRLGIRAEAIPKELRGRRDLVVEVFIQTQGFSGG